MVYQQSGKSLEQCRDCGIHGDFFGRIPAIQAIDSGSQKVCADSGSVLLRALFRIRYHRLHLCFRGAVLCLSCEPYRNQSVLFLGFLHHEKAHKASAVRADDGHGHIHSRAEPDCAGYAADAGLICVTEHSFFVPWPQEKR